MLAISLGFIASVVFASIASHYLPKVGLMSDSKLLLRPSEAPHAEPQSEDAPIFHIKVGDEGIAASALRPVGEVRFGEDLIDAISHVGLIERGRQVRVVKREGNRLVVEEVQT
jgi:membrane-bound ClpP family serine protease